MRRFEESVPDHVQVMVSRGYRKRGCGVVLLKHVKNPIRLAREMLVRGETDGGGTGNGGKGDPSGGAGGAQGHCVLGGPTAEALAEQWGLEMVEEKYFWTKKRWDEHRRGLGNEESIRSDGSAGFNDKDPCFDAGESWDGHEYLPQGTVGCVVLDRDGTICVATSTGGLTNKLSGRIGDTPTIGAGFWAEEWEEKRTGRRQGPAVQSPLATILPQGLKEVVGDCFPTLSGFSGLDLEDDDKSNSKSDTVRAVAMSGTGNGDSFLRTAATRTAAAMVRFGPSRSLASAVRDVTGPGGELQKSAGDRWGKTGEGEGGIIGVELVDGVGKVVADFNCGGMFRSWIDEAGGERVMVFREEYFF